MNAGKPPSAAVLFVCTENAARSQMAEGLARAVAPEGIVVASAGTMPGRVHPTAIATMREMGIDISSHRSKSIADLGNKRFDLVVTLCDSARQSCPVLVGVPATIHWSLEDPSAAGDGAGDVRRAFRACAEELKSCIGELFRRGYLAALVRQKENLENILNSLSEGVIAHDLNRRIFFFSRGAERLTGYSEGDGLGRDCHDVFGPSLCGDNCRFCEGCDHGTVTAAQYSTVVLSADGARKELDVSVVPLRDQGGRAIGVVASLTDRTPLRELQRRFEAEQEFRGLVGQDHKMQRIYELVRDLGQCDFPVVITGESGTGKELVARAIHDESPRRGSLFVPINCGALPQGTLESELFGHVKGAFTGAIRDKKGRFEMADGGTLFLDEVAELPQSVQVRLLRVLQESTFEPVGSETSRRVNVRIISATNKNLKDLVKREQFRDDLYYRLAVVPIELPPLRERRNDIPMLAERFLKEIAGKLGRDDVVLSPEAMSVLIMCPWPGNVRQLQNAIQFTLIRCRDSIILPRHLPPEIAEAVPVAMVSVRPDSEPGRVGRRPKLSEDSVEAALVRAGGNKAKAARMLGVGRATLYNFLREHPGLNVEDGTPG